MIARNLSSLSPLLAQTERNTELLRNMGSSFRDKRENFNPLELLLWLVALLAAFAILHLGARLVARRDPRRTYSSERALFRALCREHNLEAASRRTLVQLANFFRLPHPCQIFLRPECFDSARLSPAMNIDSAQVARLRRVLFGQLRQPAREGIAREQAVKSTS